MATLYCDYTNGDDTTGLGTSVSPWKTLQKTVNSATGGDTINIANTSAQVLAAALTWNTGFTADNTKYTIIQAWDNGGSITIQRPDETTPRLGAIIDGAGLYALNISPQKIRLKNLKIQNFVVIGDLIWIANNSSVDGCEFKDNNADGGSVLVGYIYCTINNCFFHDNYGAYIIKPIYFGQVINNFIEDNLKGVIYGGPQTILSSRSGNIIRENIFKNNEHTSDINTEFDPATIENNTFESDGSASKIAVTLSHDGCVVNNNIFYKYDGAGSKPINVIASTVDLLGYNSFYESNASTFPSQIGIDLTSFDVSTSGNPFINSALDDYTLDSVSGAASIGSGLGNPKSYIDRGAVQSQAGGGGGGSATLASAWVG
jgi:hypothetical protein